MSTCILIVGTQRSGTSLTAGITHKLGIKYPGTMLNADEHNPAGYYEAEESNNALGQMILWTQRPKYRDPIPDDLATFLNESRILPVWGWKDPRFIYASPPIIRWLEQHGVIIKPIIVKRDPTAIARSYTAYNGGDMRDAIDSVNEWQTALLWTEGVLERYDPLIIGFEEIIEHPVESVEKIAQRIGKQHADRDAAINFIDPSLRRSG